MKIGIMQPYFFPYIGYWQLINAVDEYVVYDDVNYIKRGWINRNNILSNGESKRINLHIKNASQNRLIKDTELAQTVDDNKSLLEMIKQSYHKAQCFDTVYHLLENIVNYPGNNLTDYLSNQIKEICRYLDINTRILLSSDIDKDKDLRGEEKIIAICKSRGADTYINAIGGKELYHAKNFKCENIKLKFLRTGNIYYKQYQNEFIPNLSIIDVMMFNKVSDIKCLLEQFELE